MPTKLPKKIKDAVETYQCTGCVVGSDIECGKFAQNKELGDACIGHVAGTRTNMAHVGLGLFFLGMPKGFCRTGHEEHKLRMQIFKDLDHLKRTWARTDPADTDGYGMFNVPVWKYKSAEGHVFVRGLHPKSNRTFTHVILDLEGYKDINCLEITEGIMEELD